MSIRSWASKSPERAVAFVGVNVVPMETPSASWGTDHTVVVRDGRITAIGPSGSITVPADAERIDGKGHYLVPGLADFHIHLSSDEQLSRIWPMASPPSSS